MGEGFELPKGVSIRTELRAGDLGSLVRMHGALYAREYGYGLPFEAYVAKGVGEFAESYDPELDRLWVCESGGDDVGFMAAVHREDSVQLRYFLLRPDFRGKGLGSRLVRSFLAFMDEKGYRKAYLWTTDDLKEAEHIYKAAGFRMTEEHPSTAFGKPLRERRYDLVR